MRANVYECMFILDTNKVAGDQQGVVKQLHTLLERNNAEVLASRPWSEQKLAYPIKAHNVLHKKGLYYLVYFRTESKNLVNIERDLKLNETIVRNMIMRVDSKLVDIMLQLARDERAMALQTVNAPPPEDDLGMRGDDTERGPRRPPRRAPAAVADKTEE
ncbi:MAG: 30S ribosomal protein S6 [Gemmataceae bacterium]